VLTWVAALAIVGGSEIASPVREAVVQVGHCSGTLVAADVVLTSAHCLDGPIDEIAIGARAARVVRCARHPAYQAGQPAHDIGYCRLAEAMPGAVAIDDGPEPAVGATVSLAGFGVSDPLSRQARTLRMITTSVAAVGQGKLDVGSATATACRGDSGGPMLIDRGDGLRVAGVIHGAAGAICASATEVVSVRAERDWLSHELARPSPLRIVAAALLVCAALVAAVWRRRPRRL
jgi:secreted trypsin-like serine protease